MRHTMQNMIVAAAVFISVSYAFAEVDYGHTGRYGAANKSVNNGAVILMGDSISDIWPARSPEFFKGKNLISRGISGQSTPHMLARFQTDVVGLHPRAVVILGGINDIMRSHLHMRTETIANNIISMCEIALYHKIKPYICSITPVRVDSKGIDDKIREVNQFLRTYADQNKVTYVDYYTALSNGIGGIAQELAEDGIHPTFAGYKIMEEVLTNTGIFDHVVLFGDSITWGWPDSRPDFFKDGRFEACGVCGNTSKFMMDRFVKQVINPKPKAVVILAGINDMAENAGSITKEEVRDNIAAMCELAATNGIKPYLCSVTPAAHFSWRRSITNAAERITALNILLKDYALNNNITYLDFHSAMKDERNGMLKELSGDGLHPNHKGYVIMEKILLEALEKNVTTVIP